jgi:hypothetical protein
MPRSKLPQSCPLRRVLIPPFTFTVMDFEVSPAAKLRTPDGSTPAVKKSLSTEVATNGSATVFQLTELAVVVSPDRVTV